jgi:hypothetical protein
MVPQIDELGAYQTRHRRREFIRAHHPDRGGDMDLFVAGLRAFDTGPDHVPGPLPRVVIVRRRPWLVSLAMAAVGRLRSGPRPARVR